jgi:hypothetical protein
VCVCVCVCVCMYYVCIYVCIIRIYIFNIYIILHTTYICMCVCMCVCVCVCVCVYTHTHTHTCVHIYANLLEPVRASSCASTDTSVYTTHDGLERVCARLMLALFVAPSLSIDKQRSIINIIIKNKLKNINKQTGRDRS